MKPNKLVWTNHRFTNFLLAKHTFLILTAWIIQKNFFSYLCIYWRDIKCQKGSFQSCCQSSILCRIFVLVQCTELKRRRRKKKNLIHIQSNRRNWHHIFRPGKFLSISKFIQLACLLFGNDSRQQRQQRRNNFIGKE